MTRLTDLSAIHAAMWRELDHAAQQREHAWRTPVLATVSAEGADARTVVLREVDAAAQRLVIYTDARAGKVAQLAGDPRAVLVFWSEALGWQLRMRCTFAVEISGLSVTSRWARIRHSPAAQDYLSPLPPGSPLLDDAPTARRVSGTHNPRATPREFFAVLTATVQSVDWLELHADGHRRAGFKGQEASWLVP
jgi:pyridoxamine 5'-phosphate oxidase